MGAAPSQETIEQLLPQAPFYGQRQQVVLIPLIPHFFPDADCPLFRQLYATRCDPSVRYYQCVKEVFAGADGKEDGRNSDTAVQTEAHGTGDTSTLVMECEPPECFPGVYSTRAELYDAYIAHGPQRFVYETDAAMISAYQADPHCAVRPIPCAVAFLYHFPNRLTAPHAAEGEVSGDGSAAVSAAPWLAEGCVEVLGCYVKITGFVGDVNLLNPDFALRAAAQASHTSSPTIPLPSMGDDDEDRDVAPCMELHMYLTKSAGDHNRTHVLLSAMYTYAEQWQRACLHYAAAQEAEDKANMETPPAARVGSANTTTTITAGPVSVVPDRVRAHTTHAGSTSVFDVTRDYSSASSSYYRKFLESKSATVMRSLLSATEAARQSHATATTADTDDAAAKVTSHLSGTKRHRAAPETAFLLWAAPPLPAVRLHSRRTNVPLLCFLREMRAAFMSMHVCAENLRQLQEVGDDSPLADDIAVSPATLTCNCVEYEAALDDLVMWLETMPTEVPRHPRGKVEPTADHGPATTTQAEKNIAREETYLTVYAPSWVVQRLLEHAVDCLLHNLSPLEILKAQRELQHQHNIDPPPPEPATPAAKSAEAGTPDGAPAAGANTANASAATTTAASAPQKPVCHCAMLKRLGAKCIHSADGPPCCCCKHNEDGTISRVPCQCSVNHSIGLEMKQFRLPDEDIIVEEWPPRLPSTSSPPSDTHPPDLRTLQTHRANHRLLYLVGEEPARRLSATQCLVNWLAQGHPLTVGSSNANVEELEITVTLPTTADPAAAPDGEDGSSAKASAGAEEEDGGETANKTAPPEKAVHGQCHCTDCDCEEGSPVSAQSFTIHQLPRMAPLAPFLSTLAHPHPAVWSRRTLEIFRQAAAEHERRALEKAMREEAGGEAQSMTTPLLLLRPGTVIELSQVPSATADNTPSPQPFREVRISCFPTEELLLAELRFASRKGREGHPDDPHWVRYGPGEGPPPSVDAEQDDAAGQPPQPKSEDNEEEDEDAVPARPPGGEDIVGDGSSCLWRMDLGEGADRILAVTPYFLKPTRKKHVKKKKAIPKAAAAHGTALNVFFYPLVAEEGSGAADESAGGAQGRKKSSDVVAPGGADDAETSEAIAFDDEGNPISAEKAKKKKNKKKKSKKDAAAAVDDTAADSAGHDEERTAAVATQPPLVPTTAAAPDTVEATPPTSAEVPVTEPAPRGDPPSEAAASTDVRESRLNSTAAPFMSRQSSVDPESKPAAASGPGTSQVPLPRSRNVAAPPPRTAASYQEPQRANWGYPYGADGDANYYGPEGSLMAPFSHAGAPGMPMPAGPTGYYYGGAGMGPGPASAPLGAPMPPYGAYGPPMPDPYYNGGYDPRTGQPLPPPPPPHLAHGGEYYPVGPFPPPPPGGDGYFGGMGGPGMMQPPPPPPQRQQAVPAGRTITPPVPRTRRQVSFDPTGDPTAVPTANASNSASLEQVSSATARLLAEPGSSSDAPPLLSHYNPAPVPNSLPPTSPTSAAEPAALFHSSTTPLMDLHGAHNATGSAATGELHVSVKVRHHHHHTRTVSYLSESTTTDHAAGSTVLHFSTSRTEFVEDSPRGANLIMPVQSPTSTTHRRHASFSHLTAGSSEPAGTQFGSGSAYHSGSHGIPPHHHHHHQQPPSTSSNPGGRATHTGAGSATAGSGRGAAAPAGISGHGGMGAGSIKSGDTASTTNTAKRMQASSNTYRWDWRSVTLDLGEEDP